MFWGVDNPFIQCFLQMGEEKEFPPSTTYTHKGSEIPRGLFQHLLPRQLEMQQGKSCLLQLAAQEFSTERRPVSTLSTNSWGHTRKMTSSWDLCFARGVGVKNAALLHPQRTRSAVPQCAVSSELPKTHLLSAT